MQPDISKFKKPYSFTNNVFFSKCNKHIKFKMLSNNKPKHVNKLGILN